MNTVNRTVLMGLLTMLFIWGGGITKAYTPDEGHKTLVLHPHENIMVAMEILIQS